MRAVGSGSRTEPARPGATVAPVNPTPARTARPEAADGTPPELFRPTWHARSGRLTDRKRRALDDLAVQHAVRLGSDDPAEGRAGIALEIGAGTGEAALALAAARPRLLVVAAEVHKASLARLLLDLDDSGVTNLRVAAGDGRAVLAALTPPPAGPDRPALELLRVFFPDPWPKRRHHGRRLVDAGFVTLAAQALRPGGLFELATDHGPYAAAMRAAVGSCSGFGPADGPVRADRPVTYYERRALEAGRAVHDLRHRRLDAAVTDEPGTPPGAPPGAPWT